MHWNSLYQWCFLAHRSYCQDLDLLLGHINFSSIAFIPYFVVDFGNLWYINCRTHSVFVYLVPPHPQHYTSSYCILSCCSSLFFTCPMPLTYPTSLIPCSSIIIHVVIVCRILTCNSAFESQILPFLIYFSLILLQ